MEIAPLPESPAVSSLFAAFHKPVSFKLLVYAGCWCQQASTLLVMTLHRGRDICATMEGRSAACVSVHRCMDLSFESLQVIIVV